MGQMDMGNSSTSHATKDTLGNMSNMDMNHSGSMGSNMGNMGNASTTAPDPSMNMMNMDSSSHDAIFLVLFAVLFFAVLGILWFCYRMTKE